MPKEKIKTKLLSLVKKECANYNASYDVCICDGEPCHIEAEEPCNYFEICVLTVPDYPYHPNNYEELYGLYITMTKKRKKKEIEGNFCKTCGKVQVFGKQKYCKPCAAKRKKEYNRSYYKKKN